MMTTYESLRHEGTFIHANMDDVDPKTKTIEYLCEDGSLKVMSVATLKRWYKPVGDWDTAMAAEEELVAEETTEEATEEATEEPKAKTKHRKGLSLKMTSLTYNGETKTIREWAESLNLPYPTLYDRVNRNHWSVEEAIEIPLGVSRREWSKREA